MAGVLSTDINSELGQAPATIANGQALSAAIDLKAHRAHRLNLPAGMPSVDITFQVSDDGQNWVNLYNSAGEFKIAAAQVGASRSILLDFQSFYGIRHLKVQTGTSAAPSNQAAERLITISTVPR